MLSPAMNCVTSTAPDHGSLKVTKTLGKQPRLRKSYRIGGISPPVNYAVYNNNIDTLERAIKERVFFVKRDDGFHAPPQPDQLGFARLDAIKEKFKCTVRYSTPMTYQQFADSYQGRKRTIYTNAMRSVLTAPLTRMDSYIKAFVKCEKYNFTAKKDPVPRVIQPRDPRYGISVGRFVKPIEKRIYKMIDKLWQGSTIMKGLNMTQRGKVILGHWDSFDNPVAVGLDASRFDQHVSSKALEWEHSIYEMFYPGNKELQMLLSWQRTNQGTGRCDDGKLKYKIQGKRMSGDMNTALGNCLLMSSMVYAYCESVGVHAKLVNDGDDCVVFMERRDLNRFQQNIDEYFTNLGFTMVCEEPVDVIEKVVFCQAQPVYDGSKYIMVRDPRVAISKDATIITDIPNNKVFKRWCSAVGQGGISMTGGIPVWQEFYSLLDRYSDGMKPLDHLSMLTGMRIMGRGMDRKLSKVSELARVSFYRAFGVIPEAQVAIEEEYRRQTLTYRNEACEFVTLPYLGPHP